MKKLKLSRALDNSRIKTDAGKLAEALRGKCIGRRGLCGALGIAPPCCVSSPAERLHFGLPVLSFWL
jgi:hypothetical protein